MVELGWRGAGHVISHCWGGVKGGAGPSPPAPDPSVPDASSPLAPLYSTPTRCAVLQHLVQAQLGGRAGAGVVRMQLRQI
jgi:hypothetical protein